MNTEKILNVFKKRFELLFDPKGEFKNQDKKTFEEVLLDYLILLIFVGLVAGILALIIQILKAAYLDIFLNAEIQYYRMINYSFGRATSLMFFYFFAGTFLVFILSQIVNLFFKKIKYTQTLKIMFLAMTPVLLFGFIPRLLPSLFVWTIFLFVIFSKK